MSVMNTTAAWGIVSRLLHWIMALMIFGALGVGIYMSNFIPDTVEGLGQRFELTQTHKSVGFVVFCLGVIRVVWRFLSPTPALPAEMPGWQKAASHASHLFLYILILAIPLTGWLMASSSPLNDAGGYLPQVKNEVFGLFEMPDPYPTGSEELSNLFHTLHFAFAVLLALLLIVHVAAALKHHFVDRDAILRRMVSGRS